MMFYSPFFHFYSSSYFSSLEFFFFKTQTAGLKAGMPIWQARSIRYTKQELPLEYFSVTFKPGTAFEADIKEYKHQKN